MVMWKNTLTERQTQVLSMLQEGLSVMQISRVLGVSSTAIRDLRDRAMRKIANKADSGPTRALTPRQQQIWEMLSKGLSVVDISRALQITPQSVREIRDQAVRKLGLPLQRVRNQRPMPKLPVVGAGPCRKCGAGPSSHIIEKAQSVLIRQCLICGTISYGERHGN